MVRSEIYNYDQFVECFKDKYWTQFIQAGVKEKIGYKKYEPGGGQSLSVYYLIHVCKARDLHLQ